MKIQEFMDAFDRIAKEKVGRGEEPVVTDREIRYATGEMNSVLWNTAERCVRRGLVTETRGDEMGADGLCTSYYTRTGKQL